MLTLNEMQEFLVDSQRGAPLPEALRGRRFVVLHGLDLTSMRAPIPPRDPRRKRLKPWVGYRVVGEYVDLDAALEPLWRSIVDLHAILDGAPPREATRSPWQAGLASWLASGWQTPSSEVAASNDFGVRGAKQLFPASSYVFAYFAGAPIEGESACVLELPPAPGPLSADELRLVDACRGGSIDDVRALLSSGVSPRLVTAEGDTPLHHAVARRDRAMVTALLDAGAAPAALERFGHGALWATHLEGRKVRARPRVLDGNDHLQILVDLVARGADANARDDRGHSLVDLVARTIPFREDAARFFVSKGAGSALTTAALWRSFCNDLRALHASAAARSSAPGQLRALAMIGHDTREALWAWLSVGYSAREVDPAVMLAIAQAFVAAKVSTAPHVEGGRLPSQQASVWTTSAGKEHYAAIAALLADLEGRRDRPG